MKYQLSVAIGLLVALSACGGSSDSGSSSSTPVASSSSSSSSSDSSSSSSEPVASSEWQLIWEDNFDGDTIDSGKWQFETSCWGGGNNEQQCYTDRAENAYVADGMLTIVAKREDFTGSNSPSGEGGEQTTLPYTSARLRTRGLAEWTFGRFEISAKLPAGQGTWPAIWMLPTNSPYGTWASSGEIDIMEAVNLKTQSDAPGAAEGDLETRVHGTLHYGGNWPNNVHSGAFYQLPDGANPADDFHEYALEWDAGEIRWYVDDVHYATHRDTGWYSQYEVGGELIDAPADAPFDRHSAFHMLLNLAVGGNWAGNVNEKGVDESVFPQTMQVDYVRVYECSGEPSTGQGCATLSDDAEIIEGNTPPLLQGSEFAMPPLFTMFGDSLAAGLAVNSYNPTGQVTWSDDTVDEGRGFVFNYNKAAVDGNVYFEVTAGAADLSSWQASGVLAFDYKVNSAASGSELLVKIDSGWPNASDTTVPVEPLGEWRSFSIGLEALRAKGNSLAGGAANIALITNVFVIEASGAMDVSFDNIRLEVAED
ncbi:glycoside hydrolase family 16 protein [Gilvimarinus polysaccharolyticus]|uniref:glycoside hydrolase family 16 protein n=1 Tax=Gilvimarinus polysaccharolyticus TaxID=863921 RepID=UPI0006733492|nr:glycoside hydrolase family 16 protein [Gilvimarinus polysaccharolyticus]